MTSRRRISAETVTAPATGKLKQVAGLLLCILMVLFFIFIAAPTLNRLPAIRPLAEFIEERDIDAGALYYTEIEEFSEAEINMQTTMDYPPRESATGGANRPDLND